MKLKVLVEELQNAGLLIQATGSTDTEISGITHDSRMVKGGEMFVAISGLNLNGHQFIPEALEKGARAVAGEREVYDLPVPYLQVKDSRYALALLSAAFYGHPGRKLRVIGVTGTDGKTTTVNLIHSILEAAGYKAGMISTINARIGDSVYDTGLHTTTPEAPDVQFYLAEMVKFGAQYAVLEVTSHGLHQHRVTGCEFDVAVITNITHEHLDYHQTFEAYREAKALLFRSLSTSFRKPQVPKVSVINVDDPSAPYFLAIPADSQLTYGLGPSAEVRAKDINTHPAGLKFTLVSPQGEFEIESQLVGFFNVYNILAATAVALSQGIPYEAIEAGVKKVERVKGRMEKVDLGQDFMVIVDFAHTPRALEEVLKTCRPWTKGRLIVVFGCPGLRDQAKRPMMGEIAGRLADLAVLTADDPRTEDVNEIIRQIAEGCRLAGRREGEGYVIIPDRAEAIEWAIARAQPGDLILFTGKGHEQSMSIGTVEYPWDEVEIVKTALKRRLGISY
ncbi:MAG: UDP-N-acetylmuramoyl-L-alanyl-D-glutamate--2,6-diaminopimelate ligase [Anaerolineae bacterium]|nr:UDP-N-acetylmuramoyl-L-alanyl-D-glutamate--2,6-diaminopimelate ligase [Anaerolineae bacterium]MDW8102314.1 UDP-N-acetylmuramoyl-L-alanyl-D-glutamate--2,6-diaminopimelate ligase [Anaerolineae bacterium]